MFYRPSAFFVFLDASSASSSRYRIRSCKFVIYASAMSFCSCIFLAACALISLTACSLLLASSLAFSWIWLFSPFACSNSFCSSSICLPRVSFWSEYYWCICLLSSPKSSFIWLDSAAIISRSVFRVLSIYSLHLFSRMTFISVESLSYFFSWSMAEDSSSIFLFFNSNSFEGFTILTASIFFSPLAYSNSIGREFYFSKVKV